MMRLAGMILLFLFGAVCSAGAVERMAVSATDANVRSGPGPTHDVLWKIEKFHPIEVIEASGPWLRFKDFEGDIGWIHKSLVDKTATVIVRQNGAQLRAGPGTDHPALIKLGKGIPFKILKREGRWIQLEHADGDKGWIHDSLVW
ncbi:MAG: SH3 domain-containing protein [Desulfobacterales bacterium]